MKRSERKNRMSQRILKAATELYLKKDPETVKMRELAQTIGISSATLYNYFSSKSELSRAVVMHLLTQYRDQFMDELNDPSRTFPEILRRMQLFSKRAQRNVNEKMVDLIFKMYQDNNEINLIFESQSAFWRQFVARGRAEGYIGDDQTDIAVFVYIDMFIQYFRNRQHMAKFKMTPQLLQKIDHELDTMFYRGLFGISDIDLCMEHKTKSKE